MKRSASKIICDKTKSDESASKIAKIALASNNNDKDEPSVIDTKKQSLDGSVYPDECKLVAKIYSNYEQALDAHKSNESASSTLTLFFMATIKIQVKDKKKLEGINAQCDSRFAIYQEILVTRNKNGKKVISIEKVNNYFLINESNNYYTLIHDNNQDEDKDFLNLISLCGQKLVALVLNHAYDLKSNDIYVDVYLTRHLWLPQLVQIPSQFIKIKQSYRTLSIIFGKLLQNNSSCDQFLDRFVENGIGFYNSMIVNQEINRSAMSISEDSPTQNEHNHLFDLIYHKHKKESIKIDEELNEKQLKVLNETLKSLEILRQYQIDAIKWMLFKENYYNLNRDTSNELNAKKIHPLFHKIENKHNQIIYYHKYLGAFCDEMPEHVSSLPGGILADEMGLGKTIEILAIIFINRRSKIPKYEINLEKNENNSKKCETNSQPLNFSCLCGSLAKEMKSKEILSYQCVSCHVWSHVKCTNYKGDSKDFLCPRCLTKVKPYPSGCTLIITPSVIMHQWLDEVNKHFKHKNLKVFVYKGCGESRSSGNGRTMFMQPKDLADLDICITSYDVLTSELSHVTAMDNLKDLRHAKRFMCVPSPLICVEWWRVCLDEAQMVHSTNAKCAEMANRLTAINRWCVTGTPIGKSLNDLHGLFTFIQEDPFNDKRWFTELLYDTYQQGNTKPMCDALSSVLWRTSKKFVQNQIDIPIQSEVVHWLKFSPFEKHLYERCLEQFKEKRGTQKFLANLSLNLKINQIDRDTLSKLLLPLNDLRLTCNHPQLILNRGYFLNNVNLKKDKVLSMEKSLEILIKKTKIECEQVYRTVVACMNGLAALSIIDSKYDEAIEYYRTILKSEKEYENKISLDSLQKIHTIHNLSEILELKKQTSDLNELERALNACEHEYMKKFIETRKANEFDLKEKIKSNDVTYKENKKSFDTWWIVLLESLGKDNAKSREFFEKLMRDLSINTYIYNQNTFIDALHNNYTICGKEFTNVDGLRLIIVEEIDKLFKSRSNLHEKLSIFYDDYNQELIKQASDCHLKKHAYHTSAKNKCELCKCELAMKSYKKFIVSSSQIDDDCLMSIENNKENEEMNDNVSNERQEKNEQNETGAKTIGDLEKFFRLIRAYTLGDSKLKEFHTSGSDFIRFNEILKQEYAKITKYWSSVSHEINSYDEIDMSKMRMRLRQAHEKDVKASYLIERHKIPSELQAFSLEKQQGDERIRKKLGQLLYLTNLQKSNSLKNGEKNEDECPICKMNLDLQWYVLVCGHVFCLECTERLRTSQQSECRCENCILRNTLNRHVVQCAICRETSRCDELHLVGAKATSNDLEKSSVDDFELKGDSNSTKIEGILKCVFNILRKNPHEKCLVFSLYSNMLDLIQESFKANAVNFRYLNNLSNSNKNLIDFKVDKNINVLLVPYSFGSAGLNLIEATHILLVEPNLNLGQEAQAIGRIHRLGQNKQTYVHRFLIQNSIEDLVYQMVINKQKSSESTNTQVEQSSRDDLSIAELISVFNNL